MKDYAELEKRLKTIAHNMTVTRAEDIKPARGESLPIVLREAADAISELTKRCEEAYADCAYIAGAAPDTRYALTGARLSDFIRGRTSAREAIERAAANIVPPKPEDEDGDYDLPKYGLHTQRKALVDLIVFLRAELGPRYELERLFPEDKLLSRELSREQLEQSVAKPAAEPEE